MNIINPFDGQGKPGNTRERLAQFETRLEKVEAILNVHALLFEQQRKFFYDLTKAIEENNKKDEVKH